MYAPKLLPYTAEERRTMGLHHRIDRMAEEALAEIKAMANKARREIMPKPPEKKRMEAFHEFSNEELSRMLALAGAAAPNYAAIHQQQALQNVYPGYAHSSGTVYSPLQAAMGNPFGWWMR